MFMSIRRYRIGPGQRDEVVNSKVKAMEAGGIRTSADSYGRPICVSVT